MWTKLVSFLYLSINIVNSAPVINPRATLQLPSEDPFYSPPTGFEDAEVGTVLRLKKIDNPFGIFVFEVNVQAVYQILVRSEDTFHQPIAIVSTLFIPQDSDPTKLVSYQIAEDTASENCAPSYAMQLDSSPLSWVTPQLELLLFSAALEEGYNVIVPDHEGPKATFVAGYSAGYAVLNSIRGVFNSGAVQSNYSEAEIVLWGYSGGGFASGWAASLQPTYAPELNLVGTAMGGVPVDLISSAKHLMGTVFAGFGISAIVGLTHEYPELKELVKELVYPDKYEEYTYVENICLAQILYEYAYSTFEEYSSEGEGVYTIPLVVNITDENNLSKNGMFPACPILIYSSVNDEIIPINGTDILYDLYCKNGVSVEYRKDSLSEHIITAVSGSGLALNFIKDRFNGIKANSECQVSTILSDFIYPDSFLGFGDIIISSLDIFQGKELGPSNSSSSLLESIETLLKRKE
ncbi:putative lipase 4 [[Candida] railenensis]|uniref:Lipase 4 n=1 Tax=[Candida] railenensis TaxID=45579 RepID=A0A9P0W1V6_9ASCO|nr:putative lipase 4 [[Candida] railenensis]